MRSRVAGPGAPSGRRAGPTTTEPETVLRAAGLRVTAPRRTVLGWLAEHPHATVEEVRVGVRDGHGPISPQAVYDVLRVGVEVGLVRPVHLAGHPTRFERRTDAHHHLVCRRCGRVADAEGVRDRSDCLDTAPPAGFTTDSVEVTYWGTCASCRR